MSRDYLVHWIIVGIATIVWFYGDLLHIPLAAINLAASLVPAALAHAIAYGQPSQVLPSQPSISTTTTGE